MLICDAMENDKPKMMMALNNTIKYGKENEKNIPQNHMRK